MRSLNFLFGGSRKAVLLSASFLLIGSWSFTVAAQTAPADNFDGKCIVNEATIGGSASDNIQLQVVKVQKGSDQRYYFNSTFMNRGDFFRKVSEQKGTELRKLLSPTANQEARFGGYSEAEFKRQVDACVAKSTVNDVELKRQECLHKISTADPTLGRIESSAYKFPIQATARQWKVNLQDAANTMNMRGTIMINVPKADVARAREQMRRQINSMSSELGCQVMSKAEQDQFEAAFRAQEQACEPSAPAAPAKQ